MRVRIIKKRDYYHVEKWDWWWPFWSFDSLSYNLDKARQIATDLKHPNIEEIL